MWQSAKFQTWGPQKPSSPFPMQIMSKINLASETLLGRDSSKLFRVLFLPVGLKLDLWRHSYSFPSLSTSCLGPCQHSSTAQIRVLVAAFPIHLLDKEPGKATEQGMRAWASCTHLGDPVGTPGSWLQLSPATVIMAICGWTSGRNIFLFYLSPTSSSVALSYKLIN